MAGKRRFDFVPADTMMTSSSEEQEVVTKEEAANEAAEKQQPKKVKKTSKVETLVEELEAPRNTAFEIKYVKRDKIEFHEKNDYPMEEIEELAELILDLGLVHNLEVIYDPEKDIYTIDAGERRTRAIDLLLEKFKDYEDKESIEYQNYLKHVKPFKNGYPCKLVMPTENDVLDEINTEIRLIVSNETGRKHDAVRTRAHVARLDELYRQKNEQVKKRADKINVNKTIAKTLGIGERQVKNYKAIDKLIPELKSYFDSKEITLEAGSNYAQLKEEEQRQILELLENGEDKKKINELYNNIKTLKKDVAEKENFIENLEREKEEALKKIEEKEQNYAELQEALEEERKKEAPNSEAVEQLKEKIEETNKGLEIQRKNHRTIVDEKDRIIEDLKKQLEKKNTTATGTLPAGYQEAQKLNMQIKTVEQALSELQEKYQSYQSIFTEEDPIDKSPKEFVKEIKNLLKNASAVLK